MKVNPSIARVASHLTHNQSSTKQQHDLNPPGAGEAKAMRNTPPNMQNRVRGLSTTA
jgi:hypothetical protein